MASDVEVALVITSSALTLAELASRLGRSPGAGSHDKGTQRGLQVGGKHWEQSIWRQNAVDPEAPLVAQCSQLLAEMPSTWVELASSKHDDISIWLDIAVFFKGAYFSLALPSAIVADVGAKGIGVEITAYPIASEAEMGGGAETGTGALTDGS